MAKAKKTAKASKGRTGPGKAKSSSAAKRAPARAKKAAAKPRPKPPVKTSAKPVTAPQARTPASSQPAAPQGEKKSFWSFLGIGGKPKAKVGLMDVRKS